MCEVTTLQTVPTGWIMAFFPSPDCSVSRAWQRTAAKTGQKRPKFAVFRGDNPLRIAYLTVNLTVCPNFKNMARIFGGIGKNAYLCSQTKGFDSQEPSTSARLVRCWAVPFLSRSNTNFYFYTNFNTQKKRWFTVNPPPLSGEFAIRGSSGLTAQNFGNPPCRFTRIYMLYALEKQLTIN